MSLESKLDAFLQTIVSISPHIEPDPHDVETSAKKTKQLATHLMDTAEAIDVVLKAFSEDSEDFKDLFSDLCAMTHHVECYLFNLKRAMLKLKD